MTRLRWAYLCVVGLSMLFGSCESIADIPERTLEIPKEEEENPCDHYCKISAQVCTDAYQIFHNPTDCANICKLYSSDELKCRQDELDKILESKSNEAPVYCANASISGGTKNCGGSACENYCRFMGQVCKDHEELAYPTASGEDAEECIKSCSVIPDREKMNGGSANESQFDVGKDHEGDTIQCRLVHLTLAATNATLAKEHCPHAFVNPQPMIADDGSAPKAPYCSTVVGETKPQCPDYCGVVMASCVDDDDGKHKVYESNTECLGACEALEPGNLSEYTSSNTVACRKYHAYNAVVLGNPTLHCPHAGPGGAMQCGDDCDSLCRLVERGCPDQWASKYKSDQKSCKTECDQARKDDPNYKNNGGSYSVAAARRGDKFACRLYHAAQSESQGNDKTDACEIAAGISECPFSSKQ